MDIDKNSGNLIDSNSNSNGNSNSNSNITVIVIIEWGSDSKKCLESTLSYKNSLQKIIDLKAEKSRVFFNQWGAVRTIVIVIVI